MNTFYINPAFKSSIFNNHVDVQASPIPNRASKENTSKSQERVIWKPNQESSPAQDSYFRPKRWDYKDRSFDESRQNSSLDQSLVGKSFNEDNKRQRSMSKGQEESRQVAIFKLQESISSRQPLGERKDFNKTELELAIHKRNQHVQEKNSYKKELEKQIRDKHKSQKVNELVDLSYSKSGLPIGEIHGGLDVDHQIKMMRIKANKLTRSESFGGKAESYRDRSLDLSREENSPVQNYNNNTFRGSALSFYNDRRSMAKSFIERVEEESDSHSQASPKSFIQPAGKPFGSQSNVNKKRKAIDPSESLLDPISSKYNLKKQCHEKLREALKAQFKKYEEYTTKLVEDRKKRKQVVMDDLEIQMAKEQQKKKAVVFRDKELGKQHREMDIGENKFRESVLQAKEASIAKISGRCITREKATKQKPARTQQERDGTYIRLVNDTINQLLNKRAKILEQAQKRNGTSMLERKTRDK